MREALWASVDDASRPALRRRARRRWRWRLEPTPRLPRGPQIPEEWDGEDGEPRRGVDVFPLVDVPPPHEDEVVHAVDVDEEQNPADSVVGMDALLIVRTSRPPPASQSGRAAGGG